MRLLTFIIALSLTINTYAIPDEDGVHVGDTLRIESFSSVLNYPGGKMPWRDEKSKLTILAFWSTTCTACVKGWKKLLDIQQEVGPEVRIILVNKFEDKEYVQSFIKKYHRTTGINMNLPNVCSDESLSTYFRFRTVPRYFFVENSGLISSEPEALSITSENVRKWISQGPFPIRQLLREVISVDPTKPIYVAGNGGEGEAKDFVWSTLLAKSQPGTSVQTYILHSDSVGYSITLSAATAIDLYRAAYKSHRCEPEGHTLWKLPLSRTEWILNDTLVDLRANYRKYQRYHYQSIYGRPVPDELALRDLKGNLDRFFGWDVSWEKRKRDCIVITMFDSVKASKGNRGYGVRLTETTNRINQVTVSELVQWLEVGSDWMLKQHPIIDETGFKGKLGSIEFEGNSYDLKVFDRELTKHGMHIRMEPRLVDVLVVRTKSATRP